MSFVGNNTSGATAITIENVIVGSEFRAPVNCLVSGLVFLDVVSTNAKHQKAAIYNADSGYTLVLQTSGASVGTGTNWRTFNCASTSTAILASGIDYLLCGWSYSTTGNGQMVITSGAVTTRASFATTYVSSTFPSSISGLTTGLSGTVSIYAWYTEVSTPFVITNGRVWKRNVLTRMRRNNRLHSGTVQYVRNR
jgi:hypothetical protein